MKRLIEIQSALKAPKNQKNNFGGYNYRSCEDILEAVKPLLKKYGLLLVIEDDIINVGDRYYVKANACIFTEENKLLTHCTAFAREEETKKGMDASQITGSASSYARKYALNGLFAIDDTKDADATNNHGKDEKKSNNEVLEHIRNIESCTSREDLLTYWDTLTVSEKKNAEILKVFKEIGKKYPKT